MEKMIKIVDSKLLDDAYPAKRKEISRNKKTIKFFNNFLKINPDNNGVLASLARLLAGDKNNCGSIYIGKKEEEEKLIYFASNNGENFSSYTKEVLDKLVTLAGQTKLSRESSSNFLTEEQLRKSESEFVYSFLRCLISLNISDFKSMIKSKIWKTDRKNRKIDKGCLLASEIDGKFYKSNKNEWKREDLESLKQKIRDYLNQENKPARNGFTSSVILLACYVKDAENLVSAMQLREKNSENKRNENENLDAVFNFLVSLKKRANSVEENKNKEDLTKSKNFHCECRLLENVIKIGNIGNDKEVLSTESWKEFKEAVIENRFVISKPCCFYCHNLISSIEISINEECPSFFEKINIDEISDDELFSKIAVSLDYDEKTINGNNSGYSMMVASLGNSGRIFRWVSPSVSTNSNQKLLKTIRKVSELISGCFETTSGIMKFVNENSEEISFQIKYPINDKEGEYQAERGWDTVAEIAGKPQIVVEQIL